MERRSRTLGVVVDCVSNKIVLNAVIDDPAPDMRAVPVPPVGADLAVRLEV